MLFNRNKTAEVFYARHITPGISAYQKGNSLIQKEALDDMNDSFQGKPVVLFHKDWENQIPVGYVVKSFWLPQDGYYWAEFIINDTETLNLIKNKGYKVSNGYRATQKALGGLYHDIEYNDEVVKGEYLHLAITDKPKFSEAIILDVSSFKKFKKELTDKESDLMNEKIKEAGMIFFKKTKVDNASEILSTSFEVDGKEYTVQGMIEMLKENKLNESEDKKYSVMGKEMSVNEIISDYESSDEKIKTLENELTELKTKLLNYENQQKEADDAKEKEAEEEKRIENEKKKLNERLELGNRKINEKEVVFSLTENGTLVKIEK